MDLLLIKTSSLGDVIHMLPAVTDATQALPQLRIEWLVEESFAAIPAWHPAVQRVIVISMRRWKKQLMSRQTWQEISVVRRSLHQRPYDRIIDSQGLIKSAIWTRAAGGPIVGYDRHSIREPLASCFYDRRLRVSPHLHAIDRNRQLMAQALGYNCLPTSRPDYGLQGLAERLPASSIVLPTGSVVGLHGTSREEKLWPVAGWIELANVLKSMQRTLVLPWGNDDERQRALHIANHVSNAIVLPKLDLNAMVGILDQVQAVVGVDTGLLHLAAALGKPGLALYTATPPRLTGAISDRHASIELQNLSTQQELTPNSVANALIKILQA